jgi:superfamily II DNA or RNA helicase
MKPHLHQAKYLDDIRAGWAEVDRQLVVSPTGSGKTAMFSWMAQEEAQEDGRTLVLVDQEELVWQAIDKLKQFGNVAAQAEKAEYRARLEVPAVVATVQTMVGRLNKWPADHFTLVVADEADKSITPSWQTVLNHFDPHAKVCGFTATPWRTDQRNLGEYYQRKVEHENLFTLIDKGFLAPIKVLMLPIKIDVSAVRTVGGDYDADELDNIIGPHLRKVAEAIRDHAGFRKTLVFLPLVRTAEKFADIARGVGLCAEYVHGKSEDREEILERFRRNEFDVLANSQLLTRGYDDPSIDCIVPVRPTKSTTLYHQIVGRGTRICKPHKRDLLLMDFLYQSSKHLVCRPANLIAATQAEAEAITEETVARAGMPGDVADGLDLQDVAQDASAKREEALRKKLEEHKHKKAKAISAEEFAYEHGRMDVLEYEPLFAWERAPVSPDQEKYLKRAKIDLSTVTCRGHASKLLDIYFPTQKARLASPKAVALMRRMPGLCKAIGIQSLTNVTAAQAGRFFAALKERRQ